MNLEGKTIVITGGTSGIGKDIVRLLREKSQVIVIGRSQEKLNELKAEYNNIAIYKSNLFDLQDVITVADLIVKYHDEIDILINNAAVQFTPKFIDVDFCLESLKNEVTVNFTSICYLIYCLLPSLKKESKSLILNVNSGLALAPKTASAVYCATKSGLDSLSRSLSYQLEGSNIKVLQCFLPLVDTGMTKGRGSGKITSQNAAKEIILGLVKENSRNNIGKVKILSVLMRVFPSLGRRIMKRS